MRIFRFTVKIFHHYLQVTRTWNRSKIVLSEMQITEDHYYTGTTCYIRSKTIREQWLSLNNLRGNY